MNKCLQEWLKIEWISDTRKIITGDSSTLFFLRRKIPLNAITNTKIAKKEITLKPKYKRNLIIFQSFLHEN